MFAQANSADPLHSAINAVFTTAPAGTNNVELKGGALPATPDSTGDLPLVSPPEITAATSCGSFKEQASEFLLIHSDAAHVNGDILRSIQKFPDDGDVDDLKTGILVLLEKFPHDRNLHTVVAKKINRQFENHKFILTGWGEMAAGFQISPGSVIKVFRNIDEYVQPIFDLSLEDVDADLRRNVERLAEAALRLGRSTSSLIALKNMWEDIELGLCAEAACKAALTKITRRDRLSISEALAVSGLSYNSEEDCGILDQVGTNWTAVGLAVEQTIRQTVDQMVARSGDSPAFRDISGLVLDGAFLIPRHRVSHLFSTWLSADLGRLAEADVPTVGRILRASRHLQLANMEALPVIGDRVVFELERSEKVRGTTDLVLDYLHVASSVGSTYQFGKIIPEAYRMVVRRLDTIHVSRLVESLVLSKLNQHNIHEIGLDPDAVMKNLASDGVIHGCCVHGDSVPVIHAHAWLEDLMWYSGVEGLEPLSDAQRRSIAYKMIPREDAVRKVSEFLEQETDLKLQHRVKIPSLSTIRADLLVTGPRASCVIECYEMPSREVADGDPVPIAPRAYLRHLMLAKAGQRVLYISPERILKNGEGVLDQIKAIVGA